MRLGIVVALGISVSLGSLAAQDCPAAALLPAAGTVAGALSADNCLLTDGTRYTTYRLDLPVRGRLGIEIAGTTDLQLILRDASGARLDTGTAIARPVEAGSYRLLVNGRTPEVAGTFTITTTFSAEPGVLCTNFPAIGRTQAVAGLLGSYGCTAPDATPYDGWSVNTLSAGTLTVRISSEDFTPTLVLRGSDGRALASSANGILSVPLMGDSQYLLVVASADRGGVYQLKTAFEEVPDATCRATRTLTSAENSKGVIDADSCYADIPGSGDRRYYNYYPVTLEAAGVVAFRVTSGDFAPTLYLLDESGNTLMVDSLSGGYDPSGNARGVLRVFLPSGNYVMQVFSDFASVGGYDLEYAFQADSVAPCALAPLLAADGKTGALTSSSCRTAFGLTDLYTLTLDNPGTVELDLGSADFPAVLAIRDLKDNLMVRSNEIDGVTAAHIQADLPAGSYAVAASARSYVGGYQLVSKFAAHDVPACSFNQAIDPNGGYVQRLSAASCKSAGGQPVDYYGFTLSADSLVLGVVTSSEVDGHLTLLDSAGNALRTDDNSYGGIDPLIIQYLPAGSYKLAVRDAAGGAGGLYQVDLRTVEGPRPAFCSAREALSLNASVDGSITYTGCQLQGVFASLYRITLGSDTTLDLRLNSAEFDAYLMLLDAKGNVLEEDNDSGGNLNARITVPLAAGEYYVVARPFGDYLQHGSYNLSTREVQP